MDLIHPIYLDVPMMVSFAAAIQGGLSFGSELTQEKETNKSSSGKLAGKFGLSNLFSNLFDVTAEADIAGTVAGRNQEIRHELKSHTEASIAILLYNELRRNKEYLIQPSNIIPLTNINAGSLVEVAGTLEKNAVDAIIDYIDAVNILSNLAIQPSSPTSAQPKQLSNKKMAEKLQPPKQNDLERIKETLVRDRQRTPISSAILRCKEPSGINVIITLRTANLRDLTLTELHKNSVRVVGKVTRIIDENQSMSTFENYGMALVTPETAETVFAGITASKGMVTEFSEVQIRGPALQILPLMIFV